MPQRNKGSAGGCSTPKTPHVYRSSDNQPLLLEVKEVAHLLSVGVRTVWRRSGTGELPQPISIGRAKRWLRREIEEYVAAKVLARS